VLGADGGRPTEDVAGVPGRFGWRDPAPDGNDGWIQAQRPRLLIASALEDPLLAGVYNAVAPNTGFR